MDSFDPHSVAAMRVLRIYLLVFVASLTLDGCSRVGDAYCDLRLPAATVDVVPAPVRYTLRNQYTSAQITAQSVHWERETTLGLTTAQPNSSVQVSIHATHLPVGGFCVRPSLHVELSYEPMMVDMARELEPGSCRYGEILAHEMKHVAVYRAHLQDATSRLRASLAAQYPAHRIDRFASLAEADASYQRDEASVLGREVERALDSVAAEQARVDTVEEYARLTRACSGS